MLLLFTAYSNSWNMFNLFCIKAKMCNCHCGRCIRAARVKNGKICYCCYNMGERNGKEERKSVREREGKRERERE